MKTQYYKPKDTSEVVRVVTVKRGWRKWDNERGVYAACFKDDPDARSYYALTLGDGQVWESDEKVWKDANLEPEEGGVYRVQRAGKRTQVSAWTERAENESEAARLVKEIRVLLDLLESELGGAK